MNDDDWIFDVSALPMDGTSVLLWIPTYPGAVIAAVWDSARERWCVDGCSSLAYDFDDDDIIKAWQLFPEPPTNTADAGAAGK